MFLGAVRVVFSAFYCSTAISSVSALSMYTFSAIFSKFGVVVLVGGLGCTSYILLLSPVTHDVHLHVGLLRCERLFLNLFREVVSIGNPSVLVLLGNLLSLVSLDEHVHSNPLRFAC